MRVAHVAHVGPVYKGSYILVIRIIGYFDIGRKLIQTLVLNFQCTWIFIHADVYPNREAVMFFSIVSKYQAFPSIQ